MAQQTVASPTTVVVDDGIADEGGTDNPVADDVLVEEAVMFAAGGAVLLESLQLAQKDS